MMGLLEKGRKHLIQHKTNCHTHLCITIYYKKSHDMFRSYYTHIINDKKIYNRMPLAV